MKLICIAHSKAGMKGSKIERNSETARKLIEKKICVEFVEDVEPKAKAKPKSKTKAEEKATEDK